MPFDMNSEHWANQERGMSMLRRPSATLAGLLLLASGCAEDSGHSKSTAILGKGSFEMVGPAGNNIDRRYRPLIGAVGIQRGSAPGVPGNGTCTFTHIGDGIALTAAHCVCGSKTCEQDFELVQKPCSETLEFGYTSENGSTEKFRCQTVIYAKQANRAPVVQPPPIINVNQKYLPIPSPMTVDFAIVKLSGTPSAKIALSKEGFSKARAVVLSHPEGDPLTISWGCEVSETSGTGSTLRHDCATLGGSSGAVIIDDETLKIVGIHCSCPV